MLSRDSRKQYYPSDLFYDFGTVIISDVNNNSAGTVLPSQNWKIGRYKAYCNSLDDYEVYFSGISGIDPSGASGNPQGAEIFIPVTHEISISTHIKLYNRNGAMTDKTVPFENYSTNYPTDRSKADYWSSGTEGYIKIRLDKKIISDVSLNNVLLVSLYASQRQTEHGPVPLFNAGSVTRIFRFRKAAQLMRVRVLLLICRMCGPVN